MHSDARPVFAEAPEAQAVVLQLFLRQQTNRTEKLSSAKVCHRLLSNAIAPRIGFHRVDAVRRFSTAKALNLMRLYGNYLYG